MKFAAFHISLPGFLRESDPALGKHRQYQGRGQD